MGESQEAFDRLRLIRSENIGPVTYQQLIRRFGTAARALEAIPDLAARGGGRSPRIADARRIDAELQSIRNLGAECLFLGDAAYPVLLAELGNPPPVLLWQGRLGLLQKPMVAMVGARNASAAACRFARDLANSVAEAGISIVSGLAKGIDTAAHQGSLGKATIAVIAGGLDVFYPPENEGLQRTIAECGLLLAEQPPGTEPRARHFPYRNRIIAGLARGTVVIEAAPRSGSLITARLAAEAGRQVMAVPGSPLDPRSRGCNMLIREGATLIQSVDDILELIRHFDDRAEAANHGNELRANREDAILYEAAVTDLNGSERTPVLELLGMTPVAVDELVRQSGLAAPTVQLALLELELAGRLTRHAGARVSLTN
ncbi:DNA-processing protein DprA [Sphingorhabdus sp. YGSMI21]|uniref:DNA-processing protein DprA n=1 Tax=Sphingorhabdus sp. YGSMI21 TaxID=2077182 RepID=UPI000C1ED627|nr:DNA-processing protein DprA [Sphingorhabdus sp. YGSMI21]ATW04760.1 DNA-protecting protein DprA [Sphingorhabdus sp. YGSMI21]